jgi:hypothetical protein
MKLSHRLGPFITPTDVKARTEEIGRRKIEIDDLKATILRLETEQLQRDHEEQDRVRPVFDQLHAKIILLQEEMAKHWRDYESRVTESRRQTETAIADIQNKVSTLEQKNLYALSLFAPIRHLPAEILSEIFVIAIVAYGCPALRLVHVCRSWRCVLMAMSRVWSTIKVRTWTRTDLVKFLLERTRRVSLDVEIDTDLDSGAHISDPSQSYSAFAMVAETSKQWRNLTIRSFPKEADLANLGHFKIAAAFEGPMDALESFRITGPCEMNTALSKLIDLARSRESSQLKTLELSTCDTLYHFAGTPSSAFRYLRSFKVDLPEMKEPLNILLQFEQLEDLYAHRLNLPLYSDTTRIPLVHTLKYLFLKSTSVQWMQGRRFSKLLECSIVWPHLPEALLSRPVDLPICAHFTYDDHLLQPLMAFHLPSLDKLVIRNEAWNRQRGSQQLAFIWGPNLLVEKIPRPRILHLDTQCYDQHLINALKMIPELEELVLGLVRPDALGKKFLSSMLAKKGRQDSTDTQIIESEGISMTRSSPAWVASLCPNLKVLGLKYRRWLRHHETDEINPILQRIIETRAKSPTPLQSFKFWPTKDTTDEDARELVHGNVTGGPGRH